LFYEAVRIIRGLRPTPAFCIWENVPGALSSDGGRDFGAALDALADIGALDISWRVLDAQWFGVPQRRRRIFLVADFRAERAVQVLFEPEGSGGDSEACGEAGQGLAGDVEGGAGIVSDPIAYQCHGNNVGAIGTLRQGNGGLTGGVPFVSWKRRGGFGYSESEESSATLESEGGSHQGPPMNTPMVMAWKESQNGTREGDTIGTLDSNYGSRHHNRVSVAYGFGTSSLDTPRAESAPPLMAKLNGQRTGSGPTAYMNQGMAVRRLTPRECERLMGWPDDWTRYRADGSEIPDGPRYRMIGNGVVAPVAAWIGRRLRVALEAVS
jgi:DNA (cytosine-5)-methyltransferase 1